jgi:hypothetical protein
VARLNIDFVTRLDGSFGMHRFDNDELTSISGMFQASRVEILLFFILTDIWQVP